MICEACHQNLATVHLTEIVQKTKKETHLCEECAREKGVTYGAQFSVKDFLGGLAKKGSKAPQQAPATAPPPLPLPEPQRACGTCGITFAEFRQSGRLGCHHDYEHFHEQLVPLLRKIHDDRVQHVGRIPSSIGERIEIERQVTKFRQELEEAVALENYERAAELRDAIKALEVRGAKK